MLSILKKHSFINCANTLKILRKPIFNHEIFLKQPLVLTSVLSRNSSLQPFNNVEKFTKTRMKYVIKDKVPHTYELIYHAPMDIYMSIMSGCITGFALLSTFLLTYKGVLTTEDFNVDYSTSHNIILATSNLQLIAFFIMSTSIMVLTKVLLQRYVIRIYKHDANYIAVFRGHLPGLIKKRYFEAGDVEAVKTGRYVGWKDGLYKLGNRKAFLIVDSFKTPHDLKVMITDPDMLVEEEKEEK